MSDGNLVRLAPGEAAAIQAEIERMRCEIQELSRMFKQFVETSTLLERVDAKLTILENSPRGGDDIMSILNSSDPLAAITARNRSIREQRKADRKRKT